MRNSRVLALALLASVSVAAAPSFAADRCSVKGMMQDKSFQLDTCAVAFYPDHNSVSIWFTDKPLSAAELETFHRSTYATTRGTSVSFGFCPGGGKAVADPKAVKDIETEVSHASSPMLQQKWLFKPGDKGVKVEKMSGDLKAGGKLAGKITGKVTSEQGQAYSWTADFDVTLPTLTAGAGTVCD